MTAVGAINFIYLAEGRGWRRKKLTLLSKGRDNRDQVRMVPRGKNKQNIE